jgi:pimeloyl-ACP methyl ester carboxylesterase
VTPPDHTPLPFDLHGSPRSGRPPVVLCHGVGLGPEVMASCARLLAPTGAVAVVHRPGYGRLAAAPPAPLDEQVERLAATLGAVADTAGALPALVGVSGGATLGLSLVLGHPELVSVVVLHEPLVGPLAPELHAAVADRAAHLAMTPGPDAVCAFVADLIGASTWQTLTYDERDGVAERELLVRAEVAAFAAFAPSADALEALRTAPVRVVVSTGARSPSPRRAAASVLASLAGAIPVTVPGCGHLAPVDAPVELGALVRDEARRLDPEEVCP